jgi:hypothetical protein
LRIDHLLVSEQLKPLVVDANVDRWVRGEPHPSDHAPVWIELKAGKKIRSVTKPPPGTASRAPRRQTAKRKTNPARLRK